MQTLTHVQAPKTRDNDHQMSMLERDSGHEITTEDKQLT